VQVHVRQTLRSSVTNSQIVNAMTWDAHNVVAAPVDGLAAVRAEVATYVDQFVSDWTAVHP
jgi:L-serine deaminase